MRERDADGQPDHEMGIGGRCDLDAGIQVHDGLAVLGAIETGVAVEFEQRFAAIGDVIERGHRELEVGVDRLALVLIGRDLEGHEGDELHPVSHVGGVEEGFEGEDVIAADLGTSGRQAEVDAVAEHDTVVLEGEAGRRGDPVSWSTLRLQPAHHLTTTRTSAVRPAPISTLRRVSPSPSSSSTSS